MLTFDDRNQYSVVQQYNQIPKVLSFHHGGRNNGYIIVRDQISDKPALNSIPSTRCFGIVLSNLACVTHGSTIGAACSTFDAGGLKNR